MNKKRYKHIAPTVALEGCGLDPPAQIPEMITEESCPLCGSNVYMIIHIQATTPESPIQAPLMPVCVCQQCARPRISHYS